MDFNKFDDRFRMIHEKINETLIGEPKRLYDASGYLIDVGGKRIRPLLCLLACESVGGRIEDALETAVAMELIHTFTLIHDDIMDRDELRRGVPSVHKTYGESTAILAGDLLFSKAFELCDPKVIKILAKASTEICEGQEMDMSFESRTCVTEREYLKMIRKKTAVLIRAATKCGALLGGGTRDEIDKLAEYGLNIGMAFQIQDDILGVLADEEKLGKPVGSDIVEGKKSLIAIRAIEKLEGEEKERLLEILNKRGNTRDEINLAVRLFGNSNAIRYCRRKAIQFVEMAKKAINELPDSDAKKDLRGIADFVVERRV
ncbi:MAG: polyprenyl synthetase family protein [Candidatus Altiarchaeales archaeon]|nr:MAG: polyprenyl synthetase family protein [Candidatus Altiarchaeales archaeon]